jgi:CRISPR-associated endonuclease Csn1
MEDLIKKGKEHPQIGKEIKSITRLDGEVDLKDKFKGGFYETDKGAIAHFVMYENQITKERQDFGSISTHRAIEQLTDKTKNGLVDKMEGFDIIKLSPGDLVYVPTKDESDGKTKIDWSKIEKIAKRVYKVVSADNPYFIQHQISKAIVPYQRAKNGQRGIAGEIGSDNKSSKTMEDEITIKETCIKLKMDRLGNVFNI